MPGFSEVSSEFPMYSSKLIHSSKSEPSVYQHCEISSSSPISSSCSLPCLNSLPWHTATWHIVKYLRDSLFRLLEPLLCTPSPVLCPDNSSSRQPKICSLPLQHVDCYPLLGCSSLHHNSKSVSRQKARSVVRFSSCVSSLLGISILCCLFPSSKEKKLLYIFWAIL